MLIDDLKGKLTLDKLLNFLKNHPDEIIPLKPRMPGETHIMCLCNQAARTIRGMLLEWAEKGAVDRIKVEGIFYYQTPEVIDKVREMMKESVEKEDEG